jgi:hypothetical protein
MLVRYGPKVTNQPRVPGRVTARSLLLASSGIGRTCEWVFGLLGCVLDGGCDSGFGRSRDRLRLRSEYIAWQGAWSLPRR